ncbi:hypothetical protein GCM10008955_35920 [Deinococcus malanensis]|uniref:ABC transporter domain-containing protein n=1 Tax=Deinococcus malanensis TaxID=1706855 RepID=A0ABQ2F1L0_9DEIO|nr:dipeptide/oligopeptide/nickel ABC transporter ATP-binding protein [Deinococcus malanensis]GGK38907.1 hypothetical protein GCM10008955_35920 [Deinococcus malanensis]
MSAAPTVNQDGSFLRAQRLSRSVTLPCAFPWRAPERQPLLTDLSLALFPGERVGLVGRSGSGKTTLLRALLALDRPDAGQVTCQDRPVRPASVAALRWYRRAVQFIPQDPVSTLDPRRTVEALLMEPLQQLQVPCDHHERTRDTLEQVGLSTRFLRCRPGILSGGQAQRVAIARATAIRPAYLLADEPVSGLDLPLQVQVLDVLTRLSREMGMGLLLVTHDLSVVARTCERTLVMHQGELVEDQPTASLLQNPQHPCTAQLLDAAHPPALFQGLLTAP